MVYIPCPGLSQTFFAENLTLPKFMINVTILKQSDLGLHCLSSLFSQVTSVQSFRTFTVPRVTLSHIEAHLV